MFGYDNVKTIGPVVIADLTADGTVPIYRFPSRFTKVEILSAWAMCDTAISGTGTVIQLTLYDGGTAQTPTVAGTVSSALGAAGTGDWTAKVARDFTISEGTMDGGDYLLLKYDETGTVAPLNILVQVDYVVGVGA